MALVERGAVEPCKLEAKETSSVANMLRNSNITLRACGEQATLEKLNEIIRAVKPGIDMLWQRSPSQDPIEGHTEDYISVINKGNKLTSALSGQTKLQRGKLRKDFDETINKLLDVNHVIDAERGDHYHVDGEIGRVYAYDRGWSFKMALHYTSKRSEKMLKTLVDHLPNFSTLVFGKVHEYHKCASITEKDIEFFAYLN